MARDLVRIFTELAKPWAISPGGLDELVSKAHRHEIVIDALARKAADRAAQDRTAFDDDDEGDADGPPRRGALWPGREYLRDWGGSFFERGVAVIPVYGPLIAKASWMETRSSSTRRSSRSRSTRA